MSQFLTKEIRLQIAESVRKALNFERVSASGNNKLIEEIDKKLDSLNDLYRLNESE